MKATLRTTSVFICLLSLAFTASAQRSATPDSTWNTTVIAPQCNASASPASITVGQQSTIASTGCGAPTNPVNQYQWTVSNSGPAVSGAGGTATFSTAGTYCYSIRGASIDGWGKPSPSACVNVSAVSLPSPSCTLTASPSSIGIGSTSTLTATCSNAGSSPFYSWTIPGSAPAFGGAGGNGTFNSVGTFLYSLSLWNGIAWSPSANVSITVSALPPICTVLPDLSNPTICPAPTAGTYTVSQIFNVGTCSYNAPTSNQASACTAACIPQPTITTAGNMCPAGFSGLYTTTQTYNTGTCAYNAATDDKAFACTFIALCTSLPTLSTPGNLCPVVTTGTFTITQTFNSAVGVCAYNAPTNDQGTACTPVVACPAGRTSVAGVCTAVLDPQISMISCNLNDSATISNLGGGNISINYPSSTAGDRSTIAYSWSGSSWTFASFSSGRTGLACPDIASFGTLTGIDIDQCLNVNGGCRIILGN